jgi:chromosome segregation ATPase
MKELEMKDLLTKHRNELAMKDNAIAQLRDAEQDLTKRITQKGGEIEDLQQQLAKLQTEVQQNKLDQVEFEKMTAKLKTEILLKQTAVNKLAEIMNRKDTNLPGKQKTKVSSAGDLRKKEKEARRLQLELTQERDKYNQLLLRYQDIQNQLLEENQVSGEAKGQVELTDIFMYSTFNSWKKSQKTFSSKIYSFCFRPF